MNSIFLPPSFCNAIITGVPDVNPAHAERGVRRQIPAKGDAVLKAVLDHGVLEE